MPMSAIVMVVEDDPSIGALVRTYLQRDGYQTIWVRSGEDALAELNRHPIELVVLDIGLPGIDGFEVCRRIDGRVPVIMLTARDEEADVVAGLELGADDYVSKPFSPRQLAARVKAVLRRTDAAASADDVSTLGPVTLARGSREVFVDGNEVDLTQREFDLLEYLLRRTGQVVTRDELLEAVWGFVLPGPDPHHRSPRCPAAQEARLPRAHPHGTGTRLQGEHAVTLRRRLFAFVALAAVASCVLTVGVAALLVRHQVATQRLTALERAADLVATVGGARGALTPGSHVYAVTGTVPRLRRVAARRSTLVLAAIPRMGDTQGTLTVDGRALIYAARTTPNGLVVLVRGAGLAFGEWRPFLLSLLLAGLGGALLAAILSYLLARRLTRPLAELVSATGRLAAGEHGVEVTVRGEDELAALAGSFNEMSSELARAREEQRDFLESVSHELKTPLTSIRGYAEALDEGAVPVADGARVISVEARRLERLVQDLLDLARLGRSGFEVEHEPIDLASVARRAVERHLPRAHELGIELAATGAPEARAVGDSERLLQATSNLIENALRLTPAGGSVEVGVKSTPADSLITVLDTGPGLEPGDVPHAFERFYLYDRYRSERPVGSGLGLAIVEQLVARMGGSVEARAVPGGGAMFTLRLPAARTAPPAPAAARGELAGS